MGFCLGKKYCRVLLGFFLVMYGEKDCHLMAVFFKGKFLVCFFQPSLFPIIVVWTFWLGRKSAWHERLSFGDSLSRLMIWLCFSTKSFAYHCCVDFLTRWFDHFSSNEHPPPYNKQINI